MLQKKNQVRLVWVLTISIIIGFFVLIVMQKQAAIDSTKVSTECPASLTMVGQGICDDGVDTAYLEIRSGQYLSQSAVLERIVGLKKNWQRMSPDKHIVSMLRVEQSSAGNSILAGVLIQYDAVSK